MNTVFLILGKETHQFARGDYNRGLFDAAVETLKPSYEVLTTVIEDGYAVEDEIAKFKAADAVIYQHPVYWFMVPPSVHRYIDEVYVSRHFFTFPYDPYGRGGLMTGKKLMLSTTWNAPWEAFGDPNAFFDGRSPEDVLLPVRKAHAYCGFEELPHFSCHDIVAHPNFEADRARYVRHLTEIFPSSSTSQRAP